MLHQAENDVDIQRTVDQIKLQINKKSNIEEVVKQSTEKISRNLNDHTEETNTFKDDVKKQIKNMNNDISSIINIKCLGKYNNGNCNCISCSNNNSKNDTTDLFKIYNDLKLKININLERCIELGEKNTESKNQLLNYQNLTNTKLNSKIEKIDEVKIESIDMNKNMKDKIQTIKEESIKNNKEINEKIEANETENNNAKLSNKEELRQIKNVNSSLKNKVDQLIQNEPKNNSLLTAKLNTLQEKMNSLEQINLETSIPKIKDDIETIKTKARDHTSNRKKDSKMLEEKNETKIKQVKTDVSKDLNDLKDELHKCNKKNESQCKSNEKKINDTKQTLLNYIEQNNYETYNKKIKELEEKTNTLEHTNREKSLTKITNQHEGLQKALKETVTNFKKNVKDSEEKCDKEVAETKKMVIKHRQDTNESI